MSPPAAGLPALAKEGGAALVIINQEPTGLDRLWPTPLGYRRKCPNARICDRCTAAAVHARVLDKIAILQTWERHTASGMTERADGTEFEPMTKNEREQLKYLVELRGLIRQELVASGQLES